MKNHPSHPRLFVLVGTFLAVAVVGARVHWRAAEAMPLTAQAGGSGCAGGEICGTSGEIRSCPTSNREGGSLRDCTTAGGQAGICYVCRNTSGDNPKNLPVPRYCLDASKRYQGNKHGTLNTR